MMTATPLRKIDPWFDLAPSVTLDLSLNRIKEDSLQAMRMALAAHRRTDELGCVLGKMLICLNEDTESFSAMAIDRRLRLAIMVARAIFEASINMMRIAVGDENVRRAPMRHARQKCFRDLDRVSDVRGSVVKVRWSGLDAIEPTQAMRDAIAEFSTKSGRESVRGWIDETVEQKMAAIIAARGDKSSVNLQLAHMGIYRHSSEVLHGSFCGAVYSLGEDLLPGPLPVLDPRPKRRVERVEILAQSISLILTELVQALSPLLGLATLGDQSRDSFEKYLKACVAACTAASKLPAQPNHPGAIAPDARTPPPQPARTDSERGS
jgi:hypothetical protein